VGGWLGGLIFGASLQNFFSIETWALAVGGSLVVLLIYGAIVGRKS
jgi:ABC-type antimicrobial peptide transport system permease subunit